MELTLNDFFAGAGGMGLGFKQAGFRIVGSYDWDKFAVQSYKANVETHVLQADIRDMTYKDVDVASVWTFGFPCQDLSVAGQQAGMMMLCNRRSCKLMFDLRESRNGECPHCGSTSISSTNRSGLFFEMMRLLGETRAYFPKALPAVIMAENVKGLGPYLGTLQREYERAGYVMQYQLFNSKYWGVPQSRERYYVVGLRADLVDKGLNFNFPVQQTENIPRLSSILESSVPEKYYMSDDKAAAIIQQAMLRLEALGDVHATLTPARVEKRQNGRRARGDDEPMFTLTAQDIHGVIVSQLQTIYTDKDGCSYCCDANYAKGTSPNDVGKGRRTQIIEVKTADFTHPSLVDAIEHERELGIQEVAATKEVTYIHPPFYPYGVHPPIEDIILPEAGYEEPKIDVMGMLDIKAKDQCRRVYEPNGLSPTLTAVGGGYHEVKTFDYRNYRVRKLTPREYARLQGFPDTYQFVCSDSQLYKQFGNAVSMPVAQAIASKIKEALEGI